jgi:hypothetical protein
MTQRLLHRRVAVICAALGAALGLADASKACSRPAAQFSVAVPRVWSMQTQHSWGG